MIDLVPDDELRQWERCLKALDRQRVRVVRLDPEMRERLMLTWSMHSNWTTMDWAWQTYYRGVLLLDRTRQRA